MIKYFGFLACIISLIFASCTASKIDPKTYEKSKITFGSGGGFSGIETAYMVLENGQVYSVATGGEEYTLIGKIDKSKVQQILDSYKLLELNQLSYKNPGNTYKFLDVSSEGISNRITWGDKNVDERIALLYRILMKFTEESRDSMK